MFKKICSFICIIALTLGLTACGSTFGNLKAAISLASPLIQYFADQGVIDGPKAQRQKQDISDIVDVTERLDNQWKALSADAFRSEKLKLIQSAQKEYRAILNRGNFINIPAQLGAAFGIIDGIFDGLIAFYSPGITTLKSGAPKADNEQALIAKVNSDIERLKRTLKQR